MKTASDVLFARLANFKVDVDRLRENFENNVKKIPYVQYRDNQVNYVGWAVTSRDGTVEDGVQRLAMKKPGGRGVTPTSVCQGYLAEVVDKLNRYGIKPYRVRIMQLESEGDEMSMHVDATREAWRLHIPIITNPNSFFEWQREDGSIESVHLPADGSAWLVRVDVTHRAVNCSKEPAQRVHLLMGLAASPEFNMLSEPWLPVVKAEAA